MNNSPSAQFEVLSNALRVLSESIVRLRYYLHDINEPDEGISNIEIACANCLNQLYGMMTTLKDNGDIASIYEDDAITTILCIRHVLQHLGGKIKNNLRDSLKPQQIESFSLINYGASDPDFKSMPFYIDLNWILDGIQNSNNARRLPTVKSYLNIDKVKLDLNALSKSLSNVYLSIFPLITEAMRQLCIKYGNYFEATDFDSDIYYSHFKQVKALNTNDYKIT